MTGSGGVCGHNLRGHVWNRNQILRPIGRRIWRTVCSSPSALWQQTPPEPVLITIITWHFQFHLVNVCNLHLKYEYGARNESLFCMLTPLLCHVVPLNHWNCRLTMRVGKECCARDALPYTFDISVFKTIKTNSTTIRHIYNESANITEGCNVAFDTIDC